MGELTGSATQRKENLPKPQGTMGKSRQMLADIARQYRILEEAKQLGEPDNLQPYVIGCQQQLESEDTDANGESEGPAIATPCEGTAATSLAAVLQEIGFGRFHVALMLLCGAGWFADAAEVCGLQYIFVDLDKLWGTQPTDWGLLSSARSVSAVLGAFTFGMASDKFGRRVSFLISLMVSALAGAASAASTSFHVLVVLRVLTAFGNGGLLPVSAALLTDHLPPSHRESCVALMQVFFAAGAMLAIVLSWVLPHGPKVWRVFMLCLASPCGLLLFTWRWVPESPVHLHHFGEQQKLQDKLRRMAEWNGTLTPATLEMIETLEHEQQGGEGAKSSGLARLCSSGSRTQILVVSGMWCAATFASDFWFWITEMAASRAIERHHVEELMMWCRIVGIFGFLVAAALAKAGGGLQALFGALVACALVSGTIAALVSADGVQTHLIAIAIIVIAFPYDMVWSLLYATTAASFDPLCRATALSFTSASSRAAAVVAPLISSRLLLRGPGPPSHFWAISWCVAAVIAGGQLLSSAVAQSDDWKSAIRFFLFMKSSKR